MDNNYQKLINDKQLHDFDKNLYLIPNDIKQKIYSDHFDLIINAHKLGDELILKLKSKNSMELNLIDILPVLTLVLENEYAIEYLNKNYYYLDRCSGEKINYFKNLYDQIIKRKIKNFILIDDPVEDFALSWLMYLYH